MTFSYNHSQTYNSPQEVAVADILPVRLERRAAFRAWLAVSGYTVAKLAVCLQMTQPSLSKALRGERMPVRNFNALIELGVPEILLPRPEDVRTGPKTGIYAKQ